MKAKEVTVALLLLAVFWHIEPSNTVDIILKEEFSEQTEQLITLTMNMVILPAIQLKTLIDFMIRKVKANVKLEELGPVYSFFPELPKRKCSKFLKYQPAEFDHIINETTDKALEFMRNIMKLKIKTKACNNRELVQSLRCLLTVGNTLNAFYEERFKLIGPLVFKLNLTASILTKDYNICLDYIENLPNLKDPFITTKSFVKSEVPHVHVEGCEHMDAFINQITGEISWVSCNETEIDGYSLDSKYKQNEQWQLLGKIVNPFEG